MLKSAIRSVRRGVHNLLGLPDWQTIAQLERRIVDLEANLHSFSTTVTDFVPDDRVSKLETQIELVEQYTTQAFWHSLDIAYGGLLEKRQLKCIVCDHVDFRPGFATLTSECIFGGGTLERYQCPECDCVFGAQKFLELPPSLVNLDYRMLYSRYKEGASGAAEMRAFEILRSAKEEKVINWGAGAWNDTTQRIRALGYSVWSFEPNAPSSEAFTIADKAAIPAPLDGIFSNNVIEHFLDPVAQFREFHRLLSVGGRMSHSSPCYEYLYPFTRFHTFFPIGRSVEILAERTGFDVVEKIDDGEFHCVVFERN